MRNICLNGWIEYVTPSGFDAAGCYTPSGFDMVAFLLVMIMDSHENSTVT